MDRVVFACRHNAGRSQMARAFFQQLADPRRASALSAGTTPAESVHPEVAAVLREVGIDLADVRPQRLTPTLAAGTGLLVTMGCGEECPYIPGAEIEDWPLDDPKGQPLERVREIRDGIRERVAALVERRGWGGGPDQGNGRRPS
jgi:arsenate reductase